MAVPATICAGEQSQLFMFAPGETSINNYQWSPTATLNNSGIFNPVAAPNETTTYSVNVSGKSFSASGNITVNVEQQPASPVITVAEDHLVSSATEGNQWYNSQGPVEGATGQTFFPLSTETYHVINKLKNCSSEASNKIVFGFTGVKTPVENGLSVYPNPFASIFTIDYTTRSAGYIKLVLYNSLGNEVAIIESGTSSAGNHEVVFDGSHLPAGIYACKIFSSDGLKIVKVIKN